MLLSAVFLPGKDLLGQSVLDETLAAAVPPPSTSFFPLSQVHRGLHGTAYTVFEGTQPEAMEVEILGVLHNAIGPHQDMILARLHGAKPEYSGVVAGMSGSPVYIDGKLVGALAYRIGEFSKEPIAGITPIGEMLEVRDESDDAELSAGKRGLGIRDQGTELRAQSSASSAQDLNTADVRPIETPLVFSGFGPEALALWREHVPGLGLTPVAGIGGSSSGEAQPEPIIPGSAVSAVLVRGEDRKSTRLNSSHRR